MGGFSKQRDFGGKMSARRPPTFQVFFYGNPPMDEDEKESWRLFAHEELYLELMGKPPPSGAEPHHMRDAIESAKGPVNIKLVVLVFEQSGRAGGFSQYLSRLDQFLASSRERFVEDAIKELGEFSNVPNNREDPASKARYGLCMALMKAQEKDRVDGTGFFSAEHKQQLNALRSDPGLKTLFESVERNLTKDVPGKLVYNGKRPEERSRDRQEERS